MVATRTASWAPSPATQHVMQANRSRDTTPELRLRSLLHRQGLRYRVAARPLPHLRRTADIVFVSAKVAVYVDGCFWHGCPQHYVAPRANAQYWADKIATNAARDRSTDDALRDAGWLPIRIWEHDDPAEAAAIAARAVRQRMPHR